MTTDSGSAAVQPGHLYVVATPIGNLGDLSPRAQAVLAGVDRILAEDTRTSSVLLTHFGIAKPLVALHEHNEDGASAGLIEDLRAGQALALISDAGTPLISDPGFVLVRAARAAKVPVIAVPGPCAAVAALSIAGIASDRFLFCGFLPARQAARREKLRELATQRHTLIFYEASHRIAECLGDVVETFGETRRLCLARELSKRFEQSVTAPAGEVLRWLHADSNRVRGEFVLVIEGASDAPAQTDATRLLRVLLKELPASRAARVAAELTTLPRRELYAIALSLSGEA